MSNFFENHFFYLDNDYNDIETAEIVDQDHKPAVIAYNVGEKLGRTIRLRFIAPTRDHIERFQLQHTTDFRTIVAQAVQMLAEDKAPAQISVCLATVERIDDQDYMMLPAHITPSRDHQLLAVVVE